MVDFSHSEKANRALRMIEWKCKIHFRTYTWTLWQYWTASQSDVVFFRLRMKQLKKSEQQNACWWQHQNIVALNRQRLLIKEYEKPGKKYRTQNNNELTTEGTNECTQKKYCTSNEKMQNRTWPSKMVCIDIGRVWWPLCIVVCYFTHIAMFANVCTVQMTVFACFSLCFGVSPVAALPVVN